MRKLSIIILGCSILALVSACDRKDPCKEHNNLIYIEKQEPTCVEDGHIAFYGCNICNNAFDENKNLIEPEDLVLSKLGHLYVEPTYTLDLEHNCYHATTQCSRCNKEIKEDVGYTISTKQEASCEEQGILAYTSKDFKNDVFVKQEQEVKIDALGHDYENPTYIVNEDYTAITAKRICKNDDTHIETETVSLIKTYDEEHLKYIYTSEEFKNPAFTKQVIEEGLKVVDLYIAGYKSSFLINEEFTVGKLRVIAKYENDLELEILNYEIKEEVNIEKEGTYQIDISYEDVTVSYYVAYTSTYEAFPW